MSARSRKPHRTSVPIAVIPSASRLITSLRDLGYDFPQAVADLVDNSMSALATRVEIDLRFDGANSWFRIVDDGIGMDGDRITESMRYGTSRDYEEEDLGRFGLGLKTASLSQSRMLSVASRQAKGRGGIVVRQLDLDHVQRADRWEIFAIPHTRADVRLTEPLRNSPGTVALWQRLDRVLDYVHPDGARARNAMNLLVEQLAAHLAMTFHRFIAGEVEGRGKTCIVLNGRRLEAWDPFSKGEPATLVLPAHDVPLETAGGVGIVRFQPYVLPPRDRFSSEAAFHAAGGPRKWNAQQGFYIYRANRMIQSGGWSRTRAPDEHLKLARAAIDFFPELDPAFEVNVAKVRVSLPPLLRERLGSPMEEFARAAQAAYRSSGGLGDQQLSRRGRRITRARRFLEESARRVGESGALRRIIRELKHRSPDVYRSLGW